MSPGLKIVFLETYGGPLMTQSSQTYRETRHTHRRFPGEGREPDSARAARGFHLAPAFAGRRRRGGPGDRRGSPGERDQTFNRPISAAVDGSWLPVAPLSSSGRMRPAITLPSSTPHWSKLLTPQITPSTKVLCS